MRKKILGSIKKLVEWGEISDEQAMGLLVNELKKFSGMGESEDYLKFKKNSGLIYQDEPVLDIGYKLTSGKVYRFLKASEHYVYILYKLYQILSGAKYNSPEELKQIMKNSLKGKRILELGCGVGFNLKILQNLGADVSGVEIIGELAGRICGVDIRIGDAEDLDKIFLGDEKFDLIYSRDFFSTAIINEEKAKRILVKISDSLKEGGLVVHQIAFEKVGPEMKKLAIWLYNRKEGHEKIADDYFDNKECGNSHTNQFSLENQSLDSNSFELVEKTESDGELSVILRKK